MTVGTNRRILLLPVLVGFFLGCGAAEEPATVRVPRVRAFEVGQEASGQLRTISGVLAAADTSPLSFGVGGTVDQVRVTSGDTIVEHQVLATLDALPLRLALERARSELANARAKSVEADEAYERSSVLLARGVASKADEEIATARFKSARATLRAAKSEVEEAERDLQRTELRAPFAGQIADRAIEPFEEVGADKAAFVLQGDAALVVQARLPESLIRYVDYAQAVRVTFPALPDVEIVGVVSLIAARAKAGSVFSVEVQLPDADANLRPGMTASVEFSFDAYLEGQTVYLIPLSAIAIDVGLVAGHPYHPMEVPVFVFDEAAGRVRVRKVRIGGLRGSQLEVYEGLEPGEKVISAGVSFLRDDMEAELWSKELGLGDG